MNANSYYYDFSKRWLAADVKQLILRSCKIQISQNTHFLIKVLSFYIYIFKTVKHKSLLKGT